MEIKLKPELKSTCNQVMQAVASFLMLLLGSCAQRRKRIV